MRSYQTKGKYEPDFEVLGAVAFLVFLASKFIGVSLIEWFNEVNPWLVCEEPLLCSLIILSMIVVYIRRNYFNLLF